MRVATFSRPCSAYDARRHHRSSLLGSTQFLDFCSPRGFPSVLAADAGSKNQRFNDRGVVGRRYRSSESRGDLSGIAPAKDGVPGIEGEKGWRIRECAPRAAQGVLVTAGDWLITHSLPNFASSRILSTLPSSGSVCTRRVMTKWPLVCIRVRVLPHTLPAARLLAAAPTFFHEYEFPATGTPGWRSLGVECGHRGRESREGGLEHHTSQGRFWFRQCSSNNDQSMFPPLLR